MTYSVGEVSRMSGVTVRTLHHYDEIGLVSPSRRTDAGYRMYDRSDLERLQQVLVLRELEVPLRAIGTALDGGAAGRRDALRRHVLALRRRRRRLDTIIDTVERTLDAEEGDDMTDAELFGGFDPAGYEDEVKARWGETDAYKESSRRTASYKRDDWQRLGGEIEDVEAAFAALVVAGASPRSAEAIALAERARLHIDRWFYPCSHEMHAMLADGYVSDPRFTKHYEDRQVGLAQFVRDAIHANLPG